MKPRRTTANRLLSVLMLLAMMIGGMPARMVQAAPRLELAAPARVNAENPIQALYLYDDDDATATAVGSLLGENGMTVELARLADLPPEPANTRVFLPIVQAVTAGVAARQTVERVTADELGAMTAYDLIVISADMTPAVLGTTRTGEIIASGRPVVAMGQGGAQFLAAAGASLGQSNGAQATGSQTENPEGNASAAFYAGPNPVANDSVLTLYNGGQPTVVAVLPEPEAGIRRLAQLAGQSGQIAIATEDDRWGLWGFAGGPSAMTETGRALFVNLARLLTDDAVEIPLATGSLTPEPGIDPALAAALAGGQAQYALVQLYAIPDEATRAQLAELGVTLLTYMANNTYSALLSPGLDPNSEALLALVRFAGVYQPDYKVDPALGNAARASATAETAPVVEAHVVFFSDVTPATIAATLQRIVGEGYRQAAVATEWFVPNNAGIIAALAQEPTVRFIAPLTPPQDLNSTSRGPINTDDVQNLLVNGGSAQYLGLSGQGVTVAQFERRGDTSHPDLSGRIIIGGEAHANTSSHATHVAGIILGSGADSANNGGSAFQWRGHAPEARLVSESYGTDAGTTAYGDNWYDAIVSNSAQSSNHSYVQTWGTYDGTASAVDQIVRGDGVDANGNSIPARTSIFAVANQGVSAQYDDEEGFYAIYAPAKNSIGVGSTDTTDGQPSDFSSRGPTFDGRIKPDIVAPGCRESETNPSDGIVSTEQGGGYTTKCGTSMAAPVVTGVTALMFEQFRNTFGAGFNALPSTVKALLVNTAMDQVGTSTFNDPDCGCTFQYETGPDWTTGYGLVDAQAAVAAIRSKSFIEDQVSLGNTQDNFTIDVTAGMPELRFTLAWDDEPGDIATAETAAKLVNNLNLVLIAPDNTQHFPWVLDALPMTATAGDGAPDPIDQADINDNPARRDVNNRDNVEQVVVDNPMVGTWTIRVTAAALPNGNTQPYSLAGDFRTLNIVNPQTGDVAEAGDPNNPNVVLVTVEAVQPYATDTSSSLVDAAVGDFDVEIEGTPASIISGLPVGDQFWLNVLPASGVYSAGSKYDLTVRWDGHGQDTETNSILFTEREQTDRAIVLDHSGSMSGYDKMSAAQNAARLFIDQSLVDDRIAVVGFSTNTSTPYGSTAVTANPGNPELTAAKNAVDGFTPTNMTAIGKGLLEGQSQVTANASEADVIVLLSDGMENIDPRYDTPAVKGVIEPSDTIVHTVSVGPASAAHHELMEEIADDNGGDDYVVTEDGSLIAARTAATSAAATGIDAWPTTLPNRMADSYKQVAENILFEKRLFQASGAVDPNQRNAAWPLVVPSGLKRLTVAVNWSVEAHMLRLVAVDPNGKEYFVDPSNPLCRTDATHETCIIEDPTPGSWRLLVQFVETDKDNEYVVWASARTSVNFDLAVATPSNERTPGTPIHLLGFLSQGEKPLGSQQVVANVFAPNGSVEQVEFKDDGQHGDGAADDGVYGGYYVGGNAIGAYAVRGVATGNDSLGAAFTLYANTGFRMKPRVLYVYSDDRETARDYERLIEANGSVVDPTRVGDVPSVDLRKYSLVVIGPETGNLGDWGTDAALSHIVQYERPVMGLGEGGYAFFGKLKLNIGFANGAHGAEDTILVDSYGDRIWNYPYDIDLRERKTVKLYQEESKVVGIFVEERPSGVQIFGFDDDDQRYADLVLEGDWWMLWGFQDGPERMTQDGRDLFVNSLYRTMD